MVAGSGEPGGGSEVGCADNPFSRGMEPSAQSGSVDAGTCLSCTAAVHPGDQTLERFSQHLDRPGDIDTTLEFLALSFVALHQGGKREQATRVAARLLALTEPEGFVRLYLDAGLLMKHALFTFLKAPSNNESTPASDSISRPYVSRLLAAFEQEKRR